MEGHLLQVGDGAVGGRVPLNAESFAALLHLIVLASPAPKGIGVAVDPLHVAGAEADDATKVLGVVGVSIPDPRNVQRRGGEFGVGRGHVGSWQQVHIVKHKDIVRRRVARPANFGFAGHVEANVQQLAAVELAAVVSLMQRYIIL